MELVTAITEVAKCAISPIKKHIKYSPIKKHIKYLSNLESNVQSLNDEVNQLKVKRGSVQHDVDAAKRNGNNIESNVDRWLSEVNEKISVLEKDIQSDEQAAQKKCFMALCPNLKARCKFSRKAEEEAKVVANLLKKGNFSRIANRPPIQEIITFSNKDFEAFKSRTGILNGIMDALMDTGINIIGVHGMGGVGETTLVREVARQVKESKLFDSVVFTEVRRTADVENIQKQILDFLGLKFDEYTIKGRAIRLQEILKKKKILVVLDDIWAALDLDKVGIPSGDAQGGLKLLLTSRDLNVLSDGMDSKNNFSISPLTEEEAWDLFQKMADNCVQSRDLQPIAIKVARKCARLPIAIATVARALRNKKSSDEWENALRELERPSSRSFTSATTGEVYSAIHFSYEYLQSEEDKMTFLLCSLIGHNGSIENLLRYTMGLSLYGGISKIKEARKKVFSVVNTLKASCLLLDGYDDKHFDIHDVVWDVSISIASRDHGMLVQQENDVRLKELRSKEILQKCNMIALRHLDIRTELPNMLECPHLSFFFMDHHGSLKIPGDFFTQAERLKVLRLTRMLLPTVPDSIGLLHNLQTLCLEGCTLKDITIVGGLKNLEILSLAHSDIQALPKEMAQLTWLKLLDLSHCFNLQIIPPNVLSKLSELEELYMEDSFVGWEDEIISNERRNASLEELNHLSNLTTLYVDIPKGQIIPEWLLIKNLDRYKISNVYDREGRFALPKYYSRMLKFELYKNICLSFGKKMLVKKTEYLYLKQLQGVKNVLAELNNGEDFPYLKKLHIENSLEVQFITTEKIIFSQLICMTLKYLPQLINFCSDGCTAQVGEGGTSSNAFPLFNKQHVFPRLEELELCYINVRRIWHNKPPETSNCIFNLTRLVIEQCDNLEHLLSPSIARCLAQLKDFKIRSCKGLREIISMQEMELEEEQEAVIRFPQLTSLEIDDMLNLIKFCSGNYTLEFPSLKRLAIKDCPKLQEFISNEPTVQALFNQKVAIPSLERMTLCDLENVEMIFEVGEETSVVESQLIDLDIIIAPKLKQIWSRDLQGILSFQSLRRVKVWGCESLKNVFPASIAKNLPQLENLHIEWCGVEEIVGEGLNLEEQSLPLTFKFPRLSNLQLKTNNDLKGFSGKHRIVLEWPLLKTLETDYFDIQKMVASHTKK